MSENSAEYHAQSVEELILVFRGQKVILDSDLARVYGVTTKRLNEQVHRNKGRFPADFLFQLTKQEMVFLKSQIATSSLVPGKGHGGARKLPWAFTEHGAIMAANVLNSRRAVRMGVFVVRAFVRLREALAVHKDLARKLDALEKQVGTHDAQIREIFNAIRKLTNSPEIPKRRIGFLEEKRKGYK
jgi:hypothetical protein